jgi:hypothetical protein
MIMMSGSVGDMVGSQSQDWIREMIAFMHQLDRDLTESGELVFQQGLADPGTAKTVTVNNGRAIVTDGPFAEAKESLIGFWVVDVESEDRVFEVAARIASYAGQVEVRPAHDVPPNFE